LFDCRYRGRHVCLFEYSGALIKRGRDGVGSHIDLSMLEALTEWMSFPMYYAYEGASAPKRSGAEHATIYPYGPFAAGDGNVVMLWLQMSVSGRCFANKCCRMRH